MPAPRPHAAVHSRTRRDHASETAEDYAEAIAALIAAQGRARVTAIAARLGVSHVTVVRTLGRLSRAGLVQTGPRAPVRLTPAGRRLAARARRRHEIVERFLRALGVPAGAARADAEGLEHHVSRATLAAMGRFLRRPPGPDA